MFRVRAEVRAAEEPSILLETPKSAARHVQAVGRLVSDRVKDPRPVVSLHDDAAGEPRDDLARPAGRPGPNANLTTAQVELGACCTACLSLNDYAVMGREVNAIASAAKIARPGVDFGRFADSTG